MKRIKMRPVLLLALCVTTSLLGFGQETQWAYRITGVSSRYDGKLNQYTPEQILGKPDKLPAFGSSPCAWSPKTENAGVEFIEVGFAQPERIQQVAIAENFNPGAIIDITLIDSAENKISIYSNANPVVISGIQGRMFNAFFTRTNFRVCKIKMTINTTAVPGFNQFDAIGMADSKDSIKAEINIFSRSDDYGKKENLGPAINSSEDELLPVISPNGKTLYFTRQGHPDNTAPVTNQDIWESKLSSNGEFSVATNMGLPLNNAENSAAGSITPDGQRLLVLNVYLPDGKMEKGVSISTFNGTSWDLPKKVEIDDFYNNNNYGEYFLANNGKSIIMTLERKDSEGGKDLYICFPRENGTWTAPKHMGSLINTADNETSPFLCSDNKTLYFSSRGLSGFGSNDMFVTSRLDESWTKWSDPINLGNQINTSGWDAYFSLPADGEYAYYVSYENSLGKADIFRQKLPISAKPKPVVLLQGNVLHAKLKTPMRAKITYKNSITGEIVGEGFSDSLTGKFEIVLPTGFTYSILAEKPDFYSVNERIDATNLETYTELKKDLFIVPIAVGEIARLNNIFFDFNKSELKPESFTELNQLVQLLNSKPNLSIEIQGHTDDVGDAAFNQKLSLARAKSVRDFLLSKGISETRLTFNGYGETKPLIKGTNDLDRQMNRRVEFLVLSN